MHQMRLIYYSENRLDPSAGSVLHALQGILAASKRNNARLGITGALAFDSLWFFQALEGDRETVWRAFTRIMDDPRHGDVVLVESVPIEARLFGAWAMRLAVRNDEMDTLLEPFMSGGVIRPNLMSGSDIVNVLVEMTAERARAGASSGRRAEAAGRDRLPGAAAIAP